MTATIDPRLADLRKRIAELDEDAADIRSLLAYAESERWDKLDDELGEVLDRRKALVAEYRALRSEQDQAALSPAAAAAHRSEIAR